MVRPTRIELVAYSLGGCRSIQLSYERNRIYIFVGLHGVKFFAFIRMSPVGKNFPLGRVTFEKSYTLTLYRVQRAELGMDSANNRIFWQNDK